MGAARWSRVEASHAYNDKPSRHKLPPKATNKGRCRPSCWQQSHASQCAGGHLVHVTMDRIPMSLLLLCDVRSAWVALALSSNAQTSVLNAHWSASYGDRAPQHGVLRRKKPPYCPPTVVSFSWVKCACALHPHNTRAELSHMHGHVARVGTCSSVGTCTYTWQHTRSSTYQLRHCCGPSLPTIEAPSHPSHCGWQLLLRLLSSLWTGAGCCHHLRIAARSLNERCTASTCSVARCSTCVCDRTAHLSIVEFAVVQVNQPHCCVSSVCEQPHACQRAVGERSEQLSRFGLSAPAAPLMLALSKGTHMTASKHEALGMSSHNASGHHVWLSRNLPCSLQYATCHLCTVHVALPHRATAHGLCPLQLQAPAPAANQCTRQHSGATLHRCMWEQPPATTSKLLVHGDNCAVQVDYVTHAVSGSGSADFGRLGVLVRPPDGFRHHGAVQGAAAAAAVWTVRPSRAVPGAVLGQGVPLPPAPPERCPPFTALPVSSTW